MKFPRYPLQQYGTNVITKKRSLSMRYENDEKHPTKFIKQLNTFYKNFYCKIQFNESKKENFKTK